MVSFWPHKKSRLLGPSAGLHSSESDDPLHPSTSPSDNSFGLTLERRKITTSILPTTNHPTQWTSGNAQKEGRFVPAEPHLEQGKSEGQESKNEERFKMIVDPMDVLALGAATLMIGGAVVAVLALIFMAQGSIPVKDGTRMVLGCVGGSAIAGVVARFFGKKKVPRGKR